MVKTILFDLDGTLLDTKDLIIETVDEVFKEMFPEIKLTYQEKVNIFFGPPLSESFPKFCDSIEETNKAIERYKEINKKLHDQNIKTFPNAQETLKFLKKKGIKMGVVSSKAHKSCEHGLKVTNLLEYIDIIIGYDDLPEYKPSPKPILKALELLNSKPSETIYVGDHPNDIIAAYKAEVTPCGVTYSEFLQELLYERPLFIIDDLSNLKDIF